DFSGAKAAKRAGYLAKNAAQTARGLLQLDHIRVYLQERQRAILGKLEVQAAHVLEGYRRVAFADIGDAFDVSTGQMRTIGELDPLFRQALGAGEAGGKRRRRKLRLKAGRHA